MLPRRWFRRLRLNPQRTRSFLGPPCTVRSAPHVPDAGRRPRYRATLLTLAIEWRHCSSEALPLQSQARLSKETAAEASRGARTQAAPKEEESAPTVPIPGRHSLERSLARRLAARPAEVHRREAATEGAPAHREPQHGQTRVTEALLAGLAGFRGMAAVGSSDVTPRVSPRGFPHCE